MTTDAEIVLSGHDHNYQRWSPQTPSGTKDATRGIREFVVGTGGQEPLCAGDAPANVEKANDTTFGVLQLTLRAGSYDWQFIPEAGKTFTDTGSGDLSLSPRGGGRHGGRPPLPGRHWRKPQIVVSKSGGLARNLHAEDDDPS